MAKRKIHVSVPYFEGGVAGAPIMTSTDDFVDKTDLIYCVKSDRMVLVGHPFFEISESSKVKVPFVSAQQMRVFKLKLPDPNKFSFPQSGLVDLDSYRYVWSVEGLEVSRGQPMAAGISGNPKFNRKGDIENQIKTTQSGDTNDHRVPFGFDPKQTQMIIVGCKPAIGQHWEKKATVGSAASDCPVLELKTSEIEDGDLIDFGFGNLKQDGLIGNKSDIPIEMVGKVTKYPDWIKMHTDETGDSCFYMMKREQLFGRHFMEYYGKTPESPPSGTIPSNADTDGMAYKTVPSGSLISSDSSLFNKPYWFNKAQGSNNGILWGNTLYVTCADNTRNNIFNLSTATQGNGTYDETKYNEYVRHVEEYELQAIVRLCKIRLEAQLLQYLQRINKKILDDWGLGWSKPEEKVGTVGVYDGYYSSGDESEEDESSPHVAQNFLEIDCDGKLHASLPKFSLGRKYILKFGDHSLIRGKLAKRGRKA